MPTAACRLRTPAGAAPLRLALVSPAWAAPGPPPTDDGPVTLCAPEGVLRGPGGQRAQVSLCVGGGAPTMTVSTPARCRRPGSGGRPACATSGTWTARRDGGTAASGTLPYPGPGTYDVEAEGRVRSVPAGVDVYGTVRATPTQTAPLPEPGYRFEVGRTVPWVTAVLP
ncbi:hypothetical protein [Streptomyces sp. NPDC049915]|uniref:hypothetical protein n=1 Tax=Streptomyces sp. NPDC049915 TaxID=3155510 RepID=UPI0034229FF0